MTTANRQLAALVTCFAVFVPTAAVLNAAAEAGQETSKDTEKLIEQLGDDSFDVRRQAREKLLKMGRQAIPALTRTAQDRTKETAYSAVRILSRMIDGASEPDAKAATEALQKIAKGDDAIARQARETLETQRRRPPQMRGGPVPFGGGGNLRIQGGNGAVSSRQTTVVNGVLHTIVQEPGQRIEIKMEPNGPVSVSVNVAGQKLKTYKANSLDELKKKHPEGWKVYEQHSGGQVPFPNIPNMRVPQGLIDGQFGPGFDPFDPNFDPFAPGFDPFQRMRRRRPQPPAEQAAPNAGQIVQDMDSLLKSLKRKTRAPEVRQLESKLAELKREMARLRAEAGR